MTPRDEVWNEALARALDGREFEAGELVIGGRAEASERTAKDVCANMAESGWLERHRGRGPNADTYEAGERLPENLTSYGGDE
jgi:hypothetical protein